MKGHTYNLEVSKLYINKKNTTYIPLNKSKTMKMKFKERGQFNGKILACSKFFSKKEILRLECCKINFFDFLLNRKDKNKPRMVSVNSIVEVNNSIALFNRGGDVFSYKGYWDFPAGLLKFDENILNALNDRMKKDIFIDLNYFDAPKLFGFGYSKHYILLFFRVVSKFPKNIEKLFKNNKKRKLIKLKNMENFLENNKVVFPEILRELYIKKQKKIL